VVAHLGAAAGEPRASSCRFTARQSQRSGIPGVGGEPGVGTGAGVGSPRMTHGATAASFPHTWSLAKIFHPQHVSSPARTCCCSHSQALLPQKWRGGFALQAAAQHKPPAGRARPSALFRCSPRTWPQRQSPRLSTEIRDAAICNGQCTRRTPVIDSSLAVGASQHKTSQTRGG
jgi:hypothetical protein